MAGLFFNLAEQLAKNYHGREWALQLLVGAHDDFLRVKTRAFAYLNCQPLYLVEFQDA